ncbi:hypothetical protein V1514DRAFT_335689 [Lipomyces japonicus]|uniref:uncharacterized protein n=1 Tax=Lipomyces japonicus TaxID=56871 RepID=UPI0034CEE446
MTDSAQVFDEQQKQLEQLEAVREKRQVSPVPDNVVPASKKVKPDNTDDDSGPQNHAADDTARGTAGVARIKPEFLLAKDEVTTRESSQPHQRGQNKNRKFSKAREAIKLCESLITTGDCKFAQDCKFEHDINKYVAAKPVDLSGSCPVFEAIGYCPSGVKCRWLFSHYDQSNGQLIVDQEKKNNSDNGGKELNRINRDTQNILQKKKFPTPKSDIFIPYLDSLKDTSTAAAAAADNAAAYVEAPLRASEKKSLDLRGKKILSPLTTVGNLPFRRLCRYYGADVTYSEMALSLPLLQGSKSEWALPRTHTSDSTGFGVQIAAAKPWQAIKAAEVLASTCDPAAISEINLNCGCPIDLVFRSGAGSALLDSPAKLERMVHGMNAVSGDVPVTVKIRMGTRDNHPTAQKLVSRLVRQGDVAGITLHGRSRQQRYTRTADWDYIRQTARTIRQVEAELESDSIAAESERSDRKRVNFVGNGDCYSWKDWWDGVNEYEVDSVMVARGALIKPWIFEEIDCKQYLDKTATERLDMIKRFANLGLQHWGTDEYGLNNCRRFLCEFLSFSCRYVPVGILEVLPPKIQDRPPRWKGRNELETLLASNDYKDWVKISEMFLGPVHESFDFKPKHKSNAYEEG